MKSLDRERAQISEFAVATNVSRETLAGLETYAQLLTQWQRSINLVGPSTLSELWTRHFLDSWQVLTALPGASRWVDLGSGAGFPGLVIAIAMRERTDGFVSLIESNGKKAAFLNAVIRATNAPAVVHCDRIERCISKLEPAAGITARALAPLGELLDLSAPMIEKGAVAVFHKGRDLEKELAVASISWDIDYNIIPSVVENQSYLLKITSLRRR